MSLISRLLRVALASLYPTPDVKLIPQQPVNEPCHEKTNVLVSDPVQHNPGCTVTEDGWRLEISVLESRRIVLSIRAVYRFMVYIE